MTCSYETFEDDCSVQAFGKYAKNLRWKQQNLPVCEELEPRGLTGDPVLDFFCPGKGGRYYVTKQNKTKTI